MSKCPKRLLGVHKFIWCRAKNCGWETNLRFMHNVLFLVVAVSKINPIATFIVTSVLFWCSSQNKYEKSKNISFRLFSQLKTSFFSCYLSNWCEAIIFHSNAIVLNPWYQQLQSIPHGSSIKYLIKCLFRSILHYFNCTISLKNQSFALLRDFSSKFLTDTQSHNESQEWDFFHIEISSMNFQKNVLSLWLSIVRGVKEKPQRQYLKCAKINQDLSQHKLRSCERQLSANCAW